MNHIIEKLSWQGIKLKLKGERLVLLGKKEKLTKELLEQIKMQRKELVDFLKKEEFYQHISFIEDQDHYHLSHAQKRLIYEEEKVGNKGIYNIPELHVLDAIYSADKINDTFYALMEKHGILCTKFRYVDTVLRQRVYLPGQLDIPFDVIDISTAKNKKELLESITKEFFESTFQLFDQLLWKARLIKIDGQENILLFNIHHTIYDGVSSSILFSDFSACLNDENDKKIKKPKTDYKSYTAWHNKILDQANSNKWSTYWTRQAKDYPVMEFPRKQVPFNQQSDKSICFPLVFLEDQVKGLNALAIKNQVTLYVIILTIIKATLYKYVGKPDIPLLIAVDGRRRMELRNILGLFTNTLPVRTKFSETNTFIDLINKVKEQYIKVIDNQDYPYNLLIQNIRNQNTAIDFSNSVDFMVTFNEYHSHLNHTDNITPKSAKFDIEFFFEKIGGTLSLKLNFKKTLFDSVLIRNFLLNLQNVTEQLINNPFTQLKEVDVLSKTEKEKIRAFNRSNERFNQYNSVLALFQQQLIKNSNYCAYTYNHQSFTYKDLDDKSNAIANFLKANDVKKGDLVGLYLNTPTAMLDCILGILKVGAAYVPIDVRNPRDRIQYILEDTGSKLLITERELQNELPEISRILIITLDQIELNNTVFTPITIEKEDIAYVIYTSGSTGEPKGVLIKHEGLVNLVLNMQKKLTLSRSTKMLQFSSFSFDASCCEIFSTLSSGGELILLRHKDKLDVNKIIEIIKNNKVNTLIVPPSFIKFLLGKIPTVTKLISAGEPIDISLIKKIDTKKTKLFNAYGPTENTICVSMADHPLGYQENITVGPPFDNVNVFICDKNNKMVPIGVVGEICVSGKQVAKGYLNKIEVTEKAFVKNPFNVEDTLYKTGDLAKWLPDGTVAYVGRKDNQIKIRGYRIELTEIEKQIQQINGVSQSVVLVREDNKKNKQLAAFVIAENESLSSERIVAYLKTKLPEYMIPYSYTFLKEFPLTANGKINTNRLLLSVTETPPKVLSSPTTETQRQLVKIYQEVLETEISSITDNFYQMGGHSLKLFQIQAKILENMNVHVSIQNIFENQSIKALANLLDDKTSEANLETQRKIVLVEEQEYYRADLRQMKIFTRLNFSKKVFPYNVFVLAEVEDVNTKLVAKAFKTLVEENEMLRTGFFYSKGILYQRVFAKEYAQKAPFKTIDLSFEEHKNELILKYAKEYKTILYDLEGPFLWRVLLLRVNDKKSLFIWSIDHIISDGATIHILAKKLQNIYNNLKEGEYRTGVPKVQLKDYTSWQNKRLISKRSALLAYWKDKIEKLNKNWYLGKDYGDEVRKGYREILDAEMEEYYREVSQEEKAFIYGKVFSARPLIGNSYRILLPLNEWERLQELTATLKIGVFNILSACLLIMIYKQVKKEQLFIGAPVSYRNFPDIQEVAGYMMETILISGNLTFGKTVEEIIREVAKDYEETMDNVYPFEEMCDKLNIPFNSIGKVKLHLRSIDLTKKMSVETDLLNSFIENDVTPHFELNYQVDLYKEGLLFTCEYWKENFDEATIETYANAYMHIIKNVVRNPQISLEELLET